MHRSRFISSVRHLKEDERLLSVFFLFFFIYLFLFFYDFRKLEQNPLFSAYVNIRGFTSRTYKTDSGIMEYYNRMCTVGSTAISFPPMTPTSHRLHLAHCHQNAILNNRGIIYVQLVILLTWTAQPT
jgi:hypothetical protein